MVAERKSALARLIRTPALHFLVLGGLLFVANGWWQARSGVDGLASMREPLVISDKQIDQLREDFRFQFGRWPNPQEMQGVLQAAVDDEILYREALASGLDRNNEAIRDRLVKVARFVSDDPDQDDETLYQTALQLGLDRSDTVIRRHLSAMMRLVAANTPMAGEEPIGEADLEAYLRDNPDRFTKPRRVRFTQVYLSEDRRGAGAEAEARAVLAGLRDEKIGPEAAQRFGDPFLLGNNFREQTPQTLERRLGADFANAVMALPQGGWSEPIHSTYGWHLVWIEEVEPEVVPPLKEVRERVLQAVQDQRRDQRLRETMKAMRARYAIQIGSVETGSVDGTEAKKGG